MNEQKMNKLEPKFLRLMHSNNFVYVLTRGKLKVTLHFLKVDIYNMN